MRVHGGGFSQKAHFKKWYKRIYLGIIDCMLLNSWIAWNASVEKMQRRTGRSKLKRHEYFSYIAESMLNYKDDSDIKPAASDNPTGTSAVLRQIGDEIHIPLPAKKSTRCSVCRLEHNWKKTLGEQGMTTGVVTCNCCSVSAHGHVVANSNRAIHSLECFKNLTCFQIMHTREGLDMWPRLSTLQWSNRPNQKHAIVTELRKQYEDTTSGNTEDNGSNSDSDLGDIYN